MLFGVVSVSSGSETGAVLSEEVYKPKSDWLVFSHYCQLPLKNIGSCGASAYLAQFKRP